MYEKIKNENSTLLVENINVKRDKDNLNNTKNILEGALQLRDNEFAKKMTYFEERIKSTDIENERVISYSKNLNNFFVHLSEKQEN